ncbi:DUF2778 domain-containing protein [Microvirga sp. ACRRW]|uniref:DUF2778 domain-containing protein n=1 Tax=Microvirga sp. ACRRW TaxID=2918205 RepID=UPI001EF7289A|nr:DUF2778 domain-containing protein [Microvirga sp. ACRRW]MCG7394289.1 DUF2778 domain-containing protein [Microvirga sp. ACRRW]
MTAALVAISMSPVAFFAKLQVQDAPPRIEVSARTASPTPTQAPVIAVASDDGDWSPVEPTLSMKAEALAFARNAPLATNFRPFNAPRAVANAGKPAAPTMQDNAPPASEPQIAQAPIPLPVPRPAEFRIASAPEPTKLETPRAARTRITAPMTVAAAPSAPDSSPSFFEKFFGIKPATPPESALGYAALNTGSIAPSSRFNAVPMAGDKTAVYDISAQVVIMPNGERLEAHSGLGDKMDDPRYVNVRMKGATPPGTYVLTEREALFHGVRAIRMNPVGGSAAIYGRDGILAHTYMLGPNGDSNGCVSFKDYNRFLQAFLRGEVNRMIVTAGSKQDLLPRVVSRGRSS